MVRTTTKMASRPLLLLFLFILVTAGLFVGFDVPLVSSEGMMIRARLVEGSVARRDGGIPPGVDGGELGSGAGGQHQCGEDGQRGRGHP
jgi:hypothetical protein